MRIGKVSAQATHHRSVKDLHAFGYIRYEPSFKRNCKSKVLAVSFRDVKSEVR